MVGVTDAVQLRSARVKWKQCCVVLCVSCVMWAGALYIGRYKYGAYEVAVLVTIGG